MPRPVVCITPGGRLSREAAAGLGSGLGDAPWMSCSLAGYLAEPEASSRILLCPAGASVAADLAFLRRAARRLLWPPPSADFRDAIGGLRSAPAGPRPGFGPWAPRPARRSRAGATAQAILLEGRVEPRRIRAVLASGAPRDWIVESPRHVVLPASVSGSVERAGVRWSALEPVEVVALYAGRRLAAARARWRRLLPPRTPVWIRAEAEVATASRLRRPRRS